MAGILGLSQAKSQPKLTGIQIQTSVSGKAIPIAYGGVRIGDNLIWYGDFVQVNTPVHSGKGGVLSGGKGATQATYYAAVAMGLCEGPISAFGGVYADKSVTSLSGLGLSGFTGSYSQAPWGYLSSIHPTQVLAYRGLAYVAGQSYNLGSSASLPNHTFVIGAFGWGAAVPGIADADPSFIVSDLLTSAHYGVGFPGGKIGSLTAFQDYCFALGLFMSVTIDAQRPASSILSELVQAANCEWVWANDALTIVPYGDTAATANGHTFTPPAAPLFDLDDNDFCPKTGDDPISCTRSRPSDALNLLKREYVNSANNYNLDTVTVSDPAGIKQYGLRQDSSKQLHMFTTGARAKLAAQLELQRQAIRNTYTFRLDARYACLDPMDIVSITDARLGLSRQWVRITDIAEESDDGEHNDYVLVTAEEYLTGTGHAAVYDLEQNDGFAADYNAAPDPALAPIIFEPPLGLVTESEVWIGIAGSGPNWGGADVWFSSDGTEYRKIGRVTSSAALGMLTAKLPAVAVSPIGQTIDQANLLSVDLSASGGSLNSTSVADAAALNTLCYADGELLAFANASLTGTDKYDLSYLVRGAYGTVPGDHLAGTKFFKLDTGVLKAPFTPERIGATVYVKILSFNVYGGGQEQLADVSPYTYTLVGESLTSPLPVVQNYRSAFVDGKLWQYWDDVSDPRGPVYEVRKGPSFDSAQILGLYAHAPVPVFGNDTYWVTAYAEPASGIIVRSLTPTSIVVAGSAIVQNVIASRDEQATGWPGTLGAGLDIDGGFIRTKS